MKYPKLAVLLVLLFMLMSCSDNSQTKGLKFQLKLLPEKFSDFAFVKMDYTFEFTNEFKGFDKDYMVFVHFWRLKNKEMLFQDDHQPEKVSSKWKAGSKYTYSRKVFIPKFLDELDVDFKGYEDIRVSIGLFWPKELNEKIILFQKELRFQPASYIAPDIVYNEGWNVIETNMKVKNPQQRTWRWTTKKADCIIENPKKKSTLIIKGGVDKAIYLDQKVIIKINGKTLEEFVPESAKFAKSYTLTRDQMGEDDEFTLTIETDKTFIPSAINPQSKDKRELGVQIYFLYFRESLE